MWFTGLTPRIKIRPPLPLWMGSVHQRSTGHKPFQLISSFPAFFNLELKFPDRYWETIRETRSVVDIPGVRLVGRNLPGGDR